MKKSLLTIMMASLMLVAIFSAVSISAQRSAKRDTDVIIINANNGITTSNPPDCSAIWRLIQTMIGMQLAAFDRAASLVNEEGYSPFDSIVQMYLEEGRSYTSLINDLFEQYRECLAGPPPNLEDSTGCCSLCAQLSTAVE